MKFILKCIIAKLLEWEARLVLKKYKPRIIAITGSVGKTSTKDAVYLALEKSFYVRKSEKSYNSEIGIPLTILGVSNAWANIFLWIKNLLHGVALLILSSDYPRVLVLEVGADRPGDIEQVASWLKPDTVVLTRFSDIPVHVEFFKSPKHLIAEKLKLAEALKPGGALIINYDDEHMRSVSVPHKGSLLSYGLTEGATVRGDIGLASAIKTVFAREGGASVQISSGTLRRSLFLKGTVGVQQVYPVLAACAVALAEGVGMDTALNQLVTYRAPAGRMSLIEGINDTTIIDDSYNSSPLAVEEALNALEHIHTGAEPFSQTDKRSPQGRKIAVLGDMMELGPYSTEAHRRAGARAAETADVLVAVGIRARYIAEEAHKHKMKKRDIKTFNEAAEAAEWLTGFIDQHDIILVKGSQSMRMERVVKALMRYPEQAGELLVRQDPAWLARV